jgi:hypothetical protein
MNAQLTDRLFGDSFIMLNFEITFQGVKSWFTLSGLEMDDALLFRSLLIPESLPEEQQADLLLTIVYRYEDVFFQANRSGLVDDSTNDPITTTEEPLHQLLLCMLNKRTLHGDQNTILDLFIVLQEDHLKDVPLYPTLSGFFDQKWDNLASI